MLLEDEFFRISHGLIIVFLGPVGVGKTTVITVLTHALDLLGVKVYRTFIKAFHGISYALWVLIVRVLGLQRDLAPWLIIPKRGYTNLAKILALISAYFDALIGIPAKIIVSYFLKFMGYMVISEEYIHSTLYDYLYSYIALNIKLNSFTLLPLAIMYRLMMVCKPDLIIFLDADDFNLFYRWNARGYGDPQLRYVRGQRKFLRIILRKILDISGMVYINTNGMSVCKVVAQVLKLCLKGNT